MKKGNVLTRKNWNEVNGRHRENIDSTNGENENKSDLCMLGV